MGKKIYITEAQMKALTRALIKENVNNDKIEELLNTVKPYIEQCQNGYVSLLFEGNDCSVTLSARFNLNYKYEGSYYHATYDAPEEYPDLIFNPFEFYNLELYYLNEEGEETIEETITLDANHPLFKKCIEILEGYEEIIQEKLIDNGTIDSYFDYMEDLKERDY